MFKWLGRGRAKPAAVRAVEVTEAHRLQQEGAQLIDVREPGEYAGGHAQGARNIPLDQLVQRAGEVRGDTPVLVICQSGGRSARAQDLLTRQGTPDVRNVRGGTGAWRRAGLPLDEPPRGSDTHG